ncbi:peptide/nickel transport system substrate-binding protein [Maridesulfovibrio ferrireducens]|uniref:Peptide/nickel transport system substrate-binding protein n=1 Tax=Maridesulfovibrio ferrireducens TaxID=246191 RepID=A0A1G9JQR8_9BACT|nr:peptide-binding protein [Maridesulfovibrio ferrireducens]SDL39910.1 peptide/nickel transport system substrate-binding protein [Maridesulfovibrio ferrireducens]
MIQSVVCFVLSGCLLFLSSCGQAPGQDAEKGTSLESSVTSTEKSEPAYGGRLTEPILAEPINLISALSSDSASHSVASKLFVSPLKYNKDIELVGEAAKSFEVLDDGKLLKFTLRDDIKWTDGVPLTAEDVEFTYKLMIDPNTPTAYAADYLNIKEFKLTGKYSFEVTYDKVFARSLITWAHHILPKHLLENEKLTETRYARAPIGAGPYKLKEWIPGQRLILEANEDYFEGRPNIDEIVYRIIPDLSTQFLELKTGKLDSMMLTPQQYLFQTVGKSWEKDFQKFKYLSFSYAYLGFNTESKFFKDVLVRRAISYAINKEEIVKGVLLGLGYPAIGPYKPGTWVFNDKLVPYGYHPEKAVELLKEAGWSDTDGDGILDREGIPFAFTILTNQGNTLRIKAATIIQNRLKDVGIDVQIRTVEWAAFIKEFINKGQFDATILGWNILQDPDIYDVWHSSKAVPGGLNFVKFRNAELDELLEKGRTTLAQAERKVIYDRIQEIMHEEQPYCFLYVQMSLPIYQSRIKGLKIAPAGLDYNSNSWWIPTSSQKKLRIQQ